MCHEKEKEKVKGKKEKERKKEKIEAPSRMCLLMRPLKLLFQHSNLFCSEWDEQSIQKQKKEELSVAKLLLRRKMLKRKTKAVN